MPQILRMRGHEVTVAATVAGALREKASRPFEVLIADLHIGQPGDGFTVVSAMRRTHPTCVNIILTGYPGFESALQAIRMQVDEYLVKPADPQHLLATLDEHLQTRAPRLGLPLVKSIAQ